MLRSSILLACLCAFTSCMYQGDQVNWQRYPYLVKILVRDLNTTEISTCSGTLISPTAVLTSAKCFQSDNVNTEAQAIITQIGSNTTYNKAMLAIRKDEKIAVMRIDAVREDKLCDPAPYPPRFSRLNFHTSLLDASYQSVKAKELTEKRCRIIGFETNDDVEMFADSKDVQSLELLIRELDDNSAFSEITNPKTSGRACWDDIGAPLECAINEENIFVQVGFLHTVYAHKVKEDPLNFNTTCSNIDTMEFVVFGDVSLATNIANSDKIGVLNAQDKCF